MAKICPILFAVKVLAIHSTVKNLPLKGLFIQNGEGVPITSQISKENFEMIKK